MTPGKAGSGLCMMIIMLGLCMLSPVALAADPITLYYWGWDFVSQDVIRDYERLRDGSDGRPPIKIIVGQCASIDMTGDAQRLLCAIAGEDPPDVVYFARNCVAEWASRDAFQCLQPRVDEDLARRPDDPYTVRPEQIYRPCWEEASYEGRLYAVPIDTDNRAMFYSLDALEKHADKLIPLGCTDPNDPSRVGPPRTWDQLRECTRLLSEYDKDGKLRRVGFIPNYGNSWLFLYSWLNGGRFISPDGRTCTFNMKENVEALAYMTELYDIMGGAEKVYTFQTSMADGGDIDPFVSGKVAIKIDGSWTLPWIANTNRSLRFGVCAAPAPEGREPLSWCGGWSYVIPRGCKHPDEAWELIKYLVSPRASQIECDTLRQIARANGRIHIPRLYANKGFTEWAMKHYVYDDPTIEDTFKNATRAFVELLPKSEYRPVSPVGQILWNEHMRAMEAGLFKVHDKTDIYRNAQMALDHSTAVMQTELDRIYKPKTYPVFSWKPVVMSYGVLLLAAGALLARHFSLKARSRGYFRREYYAGFAFASPWLLGFIVFGGGPILFSLFMSFCEYDVFSPPKLVGLKNYATMFTADPLFGKSLWNTLYMAAGVPLGMAVSLAIALLLSYEIRGMAVYRTFFYLPAIMPAVAASILWIWIFNPEQGILNVILRWVGIEGPGWLQNQNWSKPALILMGLWGAGGGMIVWLAGLKGIPLHLYEAARLDGASRFRQFWHVTLPMLSPYIFFNVIMGLIGTFQIFTQAFIMTQGGPNDSTLFYAFALFNNAFRYMKMGYASALAWVLFAIVLVLTLIQIRLAPRWVHYESE